MGKVCATETSFSCFNVYALNKLDLKLSLWRSLTQQYWAACHLPTILIGDFNCVRSVVDRACYNYSAEDSSRFNNFISELGLETNIWGVVITWFGPEGKKIKLDRSLVNHSWLSLGSWHMEYLSRMSSDHKPLLLRSLPEKWGPSPFKCYD